MGAIHNIFSSRRLAPLFGLILVVAAGSALADDASPAALGPIEAPGRPAPTPELARETGAVDATLPLTRAAARQRIETMSPTDWLASYGDVTVGRPGTTLAADR